MLEGKFKVTKVLDGSRFTQGEVYEFRNGIVIDDTGGWYNHRQIKTREDFEDKIRTNYQIKWIEDDVMKVSDLKTGMWIEYEDGTLSMVLLGTENGDIVAGGSWKPINSSFLKVESLSSMHGGIKKIYQPKYNSAFLCPDGGFDMHDSKVIWERKYLKQIASLDQLEAVRKDMCKKYPISTFYISNKNGKYGILSKNLVVGVTVPNANVEITIGTLPTEYQDENTERPCSEGFNQEIVYRDYLNCLTIKDETLVDLKEEGYELKI